MGHSGGAHGYTLPVSSILTQPMHSLACTFISCALLSCRQKYKYKAQKRLFDKELTPITSSFSSSVECTDGPAAVDVPLRGFSVVIIGRLHRTKVRRRWEGTHSNPLPLYTRRFLHRVSSLRRWRGWGGVSSAGSPRTLLFASVIKVSQYVNCLSTQ